MKKRILALTLAVGIAFGCVGCVGDGTYEPDAQFGRFKVLEEQGKYYDGFLYKHYQYLVYDKDTYIIYVYDEGVRGSVSISPYYCMNADNEPEIAVYWDGMEE